MKRERERERKDARMARWNSANGLQRWVISELTEGEENVHDDGSYWRTRWALTSVRCRIRGQMEKDKVSLSLTRCLQRECFFSFRLSRGRKFLNFSLAKVTSRQVFLFLLAISLALSRSRHRTPIAETHWSHYTLDVGMQVKWCGLLFLSSPRDYLNGGNSHRHLNAKGAQVHVHFTCLLMAVMASSSHYSGGQII